MTALLLPPDLETVDGAIPLFVLALLAPLLLEALNPAELEGTSKVGVEGI